MEDLKLERLRPLDLRVCKTVGDIVEGMRFCSLHAQMLGEVAHTICEMIRSGIPPILVYDGKWNTPLGRLLERMSGKRWFRYRGSSGTFSVKVRRGENIVIVGLTSLDAEGRAEELYTHANRTIFINQFRVAKEGQAQDGYYPDVVFDDPNYVMPVLYAVLSERLEGVSYTVRELVGDLKLYPGLAKEVADCATLAHDMLTDPNYFVVLTATGALTPAKMGLVLCELIENRWVQLISSTGAIQAHGLVETAGMDHFKYNPAHSDQFLAERRLNRITTAIEPEKNLDAVEDLFNGMLPGLDASRSWSWVELNEKMGQYIVKGFPDARGILKAAAEYRVPVDIPALTDSELWNNLHLYNQRAGMEGRSEIRMDPELTTLFIKDRLISAVRAGKKLGIFTIGGGVPANNMRNFGPLVEIEKMRLGTALPDIMYSANVQICPDPTDIGHLSGCTVSEGISWRKFIPDVHWARAHTEATIALPFIVQYVREQAGLTEEK